MPFKNPNGVYAFERQIPGFDTIHGQLPRLSLGTRSKTEAKAIEAAIMRVGRIALTDPAIHDLLNAIRPRSKGRRGLLKPHDLLVVLNQPGNVSENLHALRRRLTDPPLADAYAAFLQDGPAATREDEKAQIYILQHAPAVGIRTLADLDSERITKLLVRIADEAGIKRESVRRYHKGALSKLLRHHLGSFERDRIFAGVQFQTGDHRRQLRTSIVTPAAIARLCAALDAIAANRRAQQRTRSRGDRYASLVVRVAALTAAAPAPLIRSHSRDYDPSSRILFLRGTKRARKSGPEKVSRDREIRIPSLLAPDLAHLRAEATPDGDLFPLSYSRFGTMWRRAVVEAELTQAVLNGSEERVPMRPHDLRRVFADLAERSDITLDQTRSALGHDRIEQTADYLRAERGPLSQKDADRLAALLLSA